MPKVNEAEISFLIHATEDAEKVINVVKETLEVFKDAEVVKLYGHHGNPILKVRLVLKGKEADELLKRVLKKFENEDRNAISLDLDASIDNFGRFFLRLDKQELVEGKIKRGEVDAVRLKFFIKSGKEKAKEYIRGLL